MSKKPNVNGREGGGEVARPKLTPAERAEAKRAGMSARRFAALKDVRNVKDWERLNAAERRSTGEGRREGTRK